MSFGYSRPMNDAWQRMKALLFQPFDLGRWFVLGFSAWLASFIEGGSGNGGGSGIQNSLEDDAFTNLSDLPREIWHNTTDLMADPWIASLIVTGLVVGVALTILVMWLGSRGQFMFLDNLVHRRSEVSRPWREFADLGNSLFVWQVVFTVIVLFVLAIVAVPIAIGIGGLAAADFPAAVAIPFFVAAGTLGFVLFATLIYVDFFLLHIIVPIMYRRRCSTSEAWRIFGATFREHPGTFVLYGLLVLVLSIAGGFFFFALGLVTCCVGLLLMALPYIGTVITLPFATFMRYLDLEFLGQIGPEWRTLDPLPEPPLPGTPGPGSTEFEGDGAVVRTEDVGEDTGSAEPRPEDV